MLFTEMPCSPMPSASLLQAKQGQFMMSWAAKEELEAQLSEQGEGSTPAGTSGQKEEAAQVNRASCSDVFSRHVSNASVRSNRQPRKSRRWPGRTAQTSGPHCAATSRELRMVTPYVYPTTKVVKRLLPPTHRRKELAEVTQLVDAVNKQQRLPTSAEMDTIMVRCVVLHAARTAHSPSFLLPGNSRRHWCR
jgi:hypothetical protein